MVVGSLHRPLASKLCSHSVEPPTVVGSTLWEQSLLAMQTTQGDRHTAVPFSRVEPAPTTNML